MALALLLAAACAYSLSLAPAPGNAKEENQVTVYFPNWIVYSSSENQVKNLPWDRVDCISHAFWKIAPEGDAYPIVSTDPWADTDPANPQAHFPQYARYARQHPQVDILLSIGGWTCCGYFSQMALTAQGRASFIQSCLDTLDAYPFFIGLDIDWEYPGAARKGSGSDEGNPVMGDDKANYTLLLKELRQALDGHFGKGNKKLTVCAAAAPAILEKQDYAALFPYVDRINLMTYDMTVSSDPQTGHHTALYGEVSADSAVKYLQSKGVPAGRIAIGPPLYSHGWKLKNPDGPMIGAPAERYASGDQPYRRLMAYEKAALPEGTPGWHMGYDRQAQAAYLWNDDPASDSFRAFFTYESAQSLDAKLDYLRAHSLGGIIVWQSGGDDQAAGFPMISRIYRALHR